jgi:hypothetical protein
MITETTATFTGVVVRDGGLICEYRFAYWQDGGERVYTDWKGPVMLGYPLTYAAKGLTPGTLYHCRAEVRDAVGNYPGKTQDFVTTARITISSVGRGSVVVPGEGQFLRPVGTELAVEAQAQEPFSFIGWTGTAVDAGMVADPTAAATTVVLKGDTTLQAVFKITKPGLEHLVHSYTFDDGTANDSVGDANGTLVGGAAVVDGALLTTAQDQWMEMSGAAIAMNTYPEVTIEAWYTPTAGANTGWSMLGYFGDSVNGLGSNGFFMTTARGDNKSRAAISIGDINTPWASESGADGPEYDDGQLHYMVATLTATHVNLYIDGVLYAHTALSAANKISGISQNFAYLAKGGYGGDPEWIGQIHEFNIYDNALSLAQIKANYVKGLGLVHQYTFEDGTANDSVGTANGTLVGGAVIMDGALVTSAQDQWMEMSGSAIAMNTFKEVTIEAWYTPDIEGNPSWSMLAYFGDSVNGLGSNGFFMTSARGDNKSRAAISIGDIATPWASESGADGNEYDDGLLHHMVATINATNITLFIDGVQISTTALSAANKISGISQNFAYLAKGGYSGDPEWIGQIHEFSIFNTALSPVAVAARFKAGAVNSLVHQYTFDDGTANDSIDSANGTLVGGAKVENGALVTTAQDQWMEMSGATIAMNTYPEVTIEAWYTPTANANTSWSMLAYFGDSVNGLGSNGFFMTTARGDNKSRAAISIGDVATPWASESGADGPEYDDGKLHQMVATVTAMDITLYIDGTLLSTTALSEINKISALSQNFAYLAKGGYSGDPEWIGQIHEFSIYKRAKSELEVFDMYLLNVERFSTK